MTERPDWRALLEAAVRQDERGIAGVAERIGYSRPAVSRVLAGRYGNTDKLARAVLANYGRMQCPHLQESITPHECATYAARSYSAITAADVPHWRACKRCPHNPQQGATP